MLGPSLFYVIEFDDIWNMKSGKIDWIQERPNDQEIAEMWEGTTLQEINDLSDAARLFMKTINCYKESDRVQIHQYKLITTPYMGYFVHWNKLQEINFPKNILHHKDLEEYRENLKIDEKPFVEIQKYYDDIFHLSGYLAGILAKGMAVDIDQKIAWQVSQGFVSNVFEERFLEITQFDLSIRNAKWFYNIAWDYSILLFDKKHYTVLIIDITDSD